MSTHIETVVIGGGQAGLAVSYYLSQQDRPHIVLEQASQAGNAWRNHRWHSFTLNTPNWQSWLPGAEIPGDDPDGFLPSRPMRQAADMLSKPASVALRPKTS
jgi:putative flavoprotein involved in K+ transport